MYFEIQEIEQIRGTKVRFYTIIKDGHEKTEFKDFLDRMTFLGNSNPRIMEDLEELKSQIKLIGNKFGADPRRFKNESGAFALAKYYPKRKNKDGIFGLRVYCLIVSDAIVIILNGDDKTALKNRDCPKIRMKFHEAVRLSQIISDYIKDGTLRKDGVFLTNPDNEQLFI